MQAVDHLLIGAADLQHGVAWARSVLGVEPVLGGRHPRWGTANYLLSLGGGSYLEVLGPDPDAEPDHESPLFGIESCHEPRLVTWAARGSDLGALVARAHAAGVALGDVRSGFRAKPDGGVIEWELTDPGAYPFGGVVPFFIDWGDSPHPSTTSPVAGRLLSLEAEHSDPAGARRALETLDLTLPVREGPTPGLVARIERSDGLEVEIR